MAGQRSGGKKNRKIGRNQKWCEAYQARHQREKNKVVKMKRHVKRFPMDARAVKQLADVRLEARMI